MKPSDMHDYGSSSRFFEYGIPGSPTKAVGQTAVTCKTLKAWLEGTTAALPVNPGVVENHTKQGALK